MTFVYIKNPVVADNLASMGFSYIITSVNKDKFYAFDNTPELISELSCKYDASEYFTGCKINF